VRILDISRGFIGSGVSNSKIAPRVSGCTVQSIWSAGSPLVFATTGLLAFEFLHDGVNCYE
jgi:hypothetical protein